MHAYGVQVRSNEDEYGADDGDSSLGIALEVSSRRSSPTKGPSLVSSSGSRAPSFVVELSSGEESRNHAQSTIRICAVPQERLTERGSRDDRLLTHS